MRSSLRLNEHRTNLPIPREHLYMKLNSVDRYPLHSVKSWTCFLNDDDSAQSIREEKRED